MTSGDRVARTFDPRTNSLNLFRLVLAAMVLFAHAFYIAGRGIGPHIQGENLGGWAVAGFFVLSGFLITRSRFRHRLGDYLVLRMARILPAFWVCLLMTVVVFAPLALVLQSRSLDGYLTTGPTPFSFLWSNWTLLMNQYDIGTTLAAVPYPGAWNGSLWSLYYEFACYLVVAAVGCFAVVRRSVTPLLVMWAVSVAVRAADGHWASYQLDERAVLLAKLLPYFLGGAVAHFVVDRYGLPHLLGAPALVLGVTALATIPHVGGQLAAPALAVGLIWLSTVLPQPRTIARHDISYGFYIYAWPMQQLLVVAGLHDQGFVLYLLVSALVTAAMATASWLLLERPVMRMAQTRVTASRSVTPV